MKPIEKMVHAKARGLVAAILCTACLSACEVTNPGPVQDEFIAQPASQQGLVNGAVRDIIDVMGDNVYTTALLAREIFPGGQTGAWGNGVSYQSGVVLPGQGPNFTNLHEARFIGETAIKRFTDVGAPDNEMYQAHLWTAFAYRLLGAWWCDAVLPSTDPDNRDPSAYEQGTTGYFERAKDNFTAALGFASSDDERDAALAGRAQVELWLQEWGDAQTDAAAVSDDFEITANMSATEETLYNDLYEANSGQFRSFTIQFTFFEDYYATTGDPRTRWGIDPDYAVATASLQGFGAVPYKPQKKYTSREDDIRLASGWEMRLVEAEAILQQNSANYPQAMALINQVRTRNLADNVDPDEGFLSAGTTPLSAWTATSATEAWTFLKRERYAELWLEGRRLGDERRWMAMGTPGSTDTPDWENPSNPGYTTLFVSQSERSFCFDIPESERDRNPNVPATGG